MINQTNSIKFKARKGQAGQSLIEYLILVAIIAIGSISVVKIVGGNLNVQLANVAQALGGTQSQKQVAFDVGKQKKRDLSNFFEDSVNSSGSSK